LNVYTKELVDLSKIDNALDSFNPQIEQINAKISKAQKVVDELKSKKAEILELIDNNNAKIISFEEQIKELKVQLDNIRKKQAKVKTEKEINALSSEEHIAKETLKYDNDEIERLNKINDLKQEELKELEEKLKEAEDNLQDVMNSIEEDMKAIEEKKASLYQERMEHVKAMDPKIREFYEKIRKWAGNTAVVKVQNQACYGCYMKINDKAYSDLIKGEEIVTCPHCGRVLYIEFESETDEA